MKKPCIARLLLIIAFASLATCAASASSSDTAQMLEGYRKKCDLPALFVIVVKDGKICDRAAVGVRKFGDPTPVTTNDLVHIGSCTKSMTAALTAIMIDEGRLHWDTTIADVFPELKGKMNPQYENVTVKQLLTMRGGVPTRPPKDAIKRAWEVQGVPADVRAEVLARFGTFHFYSKPQEVPLQQRREFVKAVLAQPPQVTPGTKFVYSNEAYTIVAAMLEKITGIPWETLITERLFKPLHMFIGHPEAGERSAVIYTLLGSCRRNGINLFEYLKDLFTRLPAAKISQIKYFTPAAWAKATAKEQGITRAA